MNDLTKCEEKTITDLKKLLCRSVEQIEYFKKNTERLIIIANKLKEGAGMLPNKESRDKVQVKGLVYDFENVLDAFSVLLDDNYTLLGHLESIV